MKDSFDEKEVDEQEDIINVIEKKPIYKKWWFLALIISIFIIFTFLSSGVPLFLMLLFIPLLIVVVSFISFIYMLIKYRKQVFKKWWFWVLLGLFIFAIWFMIIFKYHHLFSHGF